MHRIYMQTILLSDVSVFMSVCLFPGFQVDETSAADMQVCVGHTFPTEVECSCTSSRKFPSKLQSAMVVWSVLLACSCATDAGMKRTCRIEREHRFAVCNTRVSFEIRLITQISREKRLNKVSSADKAGTEMDGWMMDGEFVIFLFLGNLCLLES